MKQFSHHCSCVSGLWDRLNNWNLLRFSGSLFLWLLWFIFNLLFTKICLNLGLFRLGLTFTWDIYLTDLAIFLVVLILNFVLSLLDFAHRGFSLWLLNFLVYHLNLGALTGFVNKVFGHWLLIRLVNHLNLRGLAGNVKQGLRLNLNRHIIK